MAFKILADVSNLADLAELVTSLPVPVMFDHLGHFSISRLSITPLLMRLYAYLGMVRFGRKFPLHIVRLVLP